MTSWQRQGDSGTATLAVPPKVGTDKDRTHTFSWERWFRHATSQQRAAALQLASQQGILYPHQLPAVTNGVKPVPAVVKETDASLRLAALLAGAGERLPSFEFEPVSCVDCDLDAFQQLAVQCVLSTPDLALLRGVPGSGKSRVLAEIIRQYALRGRRVLLLGVQAASMDVVLERLADSPQVLALRCLDATEQASAVPTAVRTLILDEQKRAFLDRLQSGVKSNREGADSACRSRSDGAAHWPALTACVEKYRDLTGRLHQLDQQSAELAACIEQEAETGNSDTPFAAKMAEWRRSRDAELTEADAKVAGLQQTLAQAQKETADLDARIAALEPAYRAKKQASFWSLAYWTNGHLIQEMDALVAQQTQRKARETAVAQECSESSKLRQSVVDRHAAEKTALIAAHLDERQRRISEERAPVIAALQEVKKEGDSTCARLGIALDEMTPEAARAAHAVWQQARERDEEQCKFAQQWSDFIEKSGADFAARLPSFANVVAATLQRALTDSRLREIIAAPVDLVIIEDAESLTDPDIARLAKLGRRSLLVSQSLEETSSPQAFDRLWNAMGGRVKMPACSWRREDERLICQLVPISADDPLERETVADAPDIELAICESASQAPTLAQVAFGPNRSFADAFQFLMREVQEFPLVPAGRSSWWTQDAETCQLRFDVQPTGSSDSADIEAGVRLTTVSEEDVIRVAGITFAKSAGWNLASAQAWLERLWPHPCNERTLFLQQPHRFRPALAAILTRLTDAGGGPTAAAEMQDASRPLEFVPVPAWTKKSWPTEGAGQELDLAAPRVSDRLPPSLRQGLPPRGFVNYIEAQALIRRLETFSQRDVNGQVVSVAVTALYESQVELLRRLATQSEILRNARVTLDIALPSQLRQREFDVVFCSLTRSNNQGAVAFGQSAEELPLALTRARARLFLFGDPGTLHQRSQAAGPIEHLSADVAAHELVVITGLLHHLQSMSQPTARVAV